MAKRQRNRKLLYFTLEPNGSYATLIMEDVLKTNRIPHDICSTEDEVKRRLSKKTYFAMFMDTIRLSESGGVGFSRSYEDSCASGLELARQVRQTGLPLIVCTASPSESVCNTLESIGAKLIKKQAPDFVKLLKEVILGYYEKR